MVLRSTRTPLRRVGSVRADQLYGTQELVLPNFYHEMQRLIKPLSWLAITNLVGLIYHAPLILSILF